MCSTRHHPHTPYSTVPCTPLDDHAYRMLAIRYYDQFTFSGHPLQSLSTPPPPPPQCCTPWGCVHHMQHRLHRSMRPSCVRGTPVVSPSLLIRVQSAPTVHPLSGIHHIVDNTYPHPPRVCAPPRAHRPPSDAGHRLGRWGCWNGAPRRLGRPESSPKPTSCCSRQRSSSRSISRSGMSARSLRRWRLGTGAGHRWQTSRNSRSGTCGRVYALQNAAVPPSPPVFDQFRFA